MGAPIGGLREVKDSRSTLKSARVLGMSSQGRKIYSEACLGVGHVESRTGDLL